MVKGQSNKRVEQVHDPTEEEANNVSDYEVIHRDVEQEATLTI